MHKVDLWLWSLALSSDERAAARACLAEDEVRRAEAFVRQVHRDRFVAARAGMREILGAEMTRPAGDIVFRYGENGKPSVEGGPEFNLSHSGDLAVLAISRDGDVGVDIEQIRPIEDGVARRHFSQQEYTALSALPQAEWLAGFYRCWTRKEAVIKCSGLGLSMPLGSFDVTLSADDAARLTRIENDDPARWALAHFNPHPGFAGAVAMRAGGQGIKLSLRRWP